MRLFGLHGAWQGQERLDAAARGAVTRAETEAAARGLPRATPDILLLVLLEEFDSVPVRALAAQGIDVAAVHAALAEARQARRRPPLEERSLLDDAAREAVILAVNEARRGGFEQVGAGHLLLGLLEAREGRGVRLLARQGVSESRLRILVNELELAGGDGGAALFAAAFEGFLATLGGAQTCPDCAAPLHASFRYCYQCGAPISNQ